MKSWQIAAVLLFLVLAGSAACNPSGGGDKEAGLQTFDVVRGDLTVSVSGSGNIEAAEDVLLTFGVAGRIDRINVRDGEHVKKGDVLAKLDTGALELALTQAQVTLVKQEAAISQQEVAIATQQVAVTQAEVGVTQKEVALSTANHSLKEARDLYTWPEIKIAQADVDDAKAYIEYVSTNLAAATTTAQETMWSNALVYAWSRLTAAEAKLDAKINSYDTEEVAIKKQEVTLAEQSLELAKQSLELAKKSLEQEQRSLVVAGQSLEQARQSVAQAKKQLDDAVITALFDGVVASVDADEGDTVSTSAAIFRLVDLSSLELKVEVDEIDVPMVKLGQKAVIEVDALPASRFEGKVAYIGVLPIVEAGIVSYEITVRISIPENSGLKMGMTATADIIIDERSGVLLVPNRAVTQDSQDNPVVGVMVEGSVQERKVVTGISDGINIEIIDGLQEGEVVVVETRPKPSGSGFFFGG